jgi:hypothetical protein
MTTTMMPMMTEKKSRRLIGFLCLMGFEGAG